MDQLKTFLASGAIDNQHLLINKYLDLETIRKERGPKAKGQIQNPTKANKGRRAQARSDAAIEEEIESYLKFMEKKTESHSGMFFNLFS